MDKKQVKFMQKNLKKQVAVSPRFYIILLSWELQNMQHSLSVFNYSVQFLMQLINNIF